MCPILQGFGRNSFDGLLLKLRNIGLTQDFLSLAKKATCQTVNNESLSMVKRQDGPP